MKILAKKSFGQNWLINEGVLNKIISAAEINSTDKVLEIGPGTGNLTSKLSKKASKVVAIEKDHRLIEILQEKFKHLTNVEIIEGDILNHTFLKTMGTFKNLGNYKVAGNIPYYLTSNLMRNIQENWPRPELVVLTIQKEVAQRVIAKPPHMNLLALSVQFYSDPKVISYVSKGSFRPIPKVDSAIIRLKPKVENLEPEETQKLFKLIKAGFSEKRKKLSGNLVSKLKIPREKIIEAFQKGGIEPNIRAENLTLEQWIILKKYLIIQKH